MRAQMIAAAVYVNCPKCGTGQPSPTGSYMWEIETLVGDIRCDNHGCAARITLGEPKTARIER